ncbi:MAG: hypothetical protein U0L43_10605 [Muribaculaceae bacterium]|nr:hypothetical protein [Muribaculaceae bacterium]
MQGFDAKYYLSTPAECGDFAGEPSGTDLAAMKAGTATFATQFLYQAQCAVGNVGINR